MSVLFIDFETRSALDLGVYGLWNYARHPSTEVYCLGYAFDDEDPQLWQPGDSFSMRIRRHIKGSGRVVAHNAKFELAIWNSVMTKWLGSCPPLSPKQVVCTMARCYAMALPGALENAAPALGMGEVKDKEGHLLMLRMCAPLNKKDVLHGAGPIWLTDKPEFTFMGKKRTPEWALARLGEYCKQDVTVERGIYRRTLALPTKEQRIWQVDYAINEKGVLFDLEAVAGALKIKDDTVKHLNEQMSSTTSGEVKACTALPALKVWAQDYGVFLDSLAKDKLEDLLTDQALPTAIRRALELRQEAGRATSVAKLDKARALADNYGRMHDLFQYYGASTGRWAGRDLQPHNFPRDLPKPKKVAAAIEAIRSGSREAVEALGEPALTTISKLLRAFIVAEPSKNLIGGDWSNVEGRGLAWLAGEEWKLEAFRECDANPDLPDMYERAYAKSFGISPEAVTDDQRQIGKVRELAFGYQGGVGAWHRMASKFGVHLTDEEVEAQKVSWRKAHPMIVQFWTALEKAAIRAVVHPGEVVSTADRAAWADAYTARKFGSLPPPPVDRQIKFKVAKPGPFLWMLLPSGRALCYPYPKILPGDYGPQLTYMSVPSQDDWKSSRIIPWPGNKRTWARLATYGGKESENATQAICRDILSEFLLRAYDKGYQTVLHVHDEPVQEGDFTEKDRKLLEEMMCLPPNWAEDFPIKAECWLAERYQK